MMFSRVNDCKLENIIVERRIIIMTKRPAPGAGMRPVPSRPLTKPGEKTYMEAFMKPVNYKNHQVTCAYKGK